MYTQIIHGEPTDTHACVLEKADTGTRPITEICICMYI